MSLREYLQLLQEQKRLVRISEAVSTQHEIAGILKRLEPSPVIFENVTGSPFRVVGNLFCSKSSFAEYFGLRPHELIHALSLAISTHAPGQVVDTAPCQEVVHLSPSLENLPILHHCSGDGGNYISSGIFVARHPRYGQNLDFHRCMQFSSTEMAVRVVKGRHFDAFLQDLNRVDVAICVGNPPNLLAAAATSVALGVDEMEIANALQPVPLVRAKTVDLMIPAEAEFVLEGTVYADRLHSEGPFVDLTETYDVVRQEPVFVLKALTHRQDAFWHALLPGALEHKLLMGMPREPTIYNKVNQVVRCLDVNINPGGCSWLHAVVQIDKQDDTDGLRAIEAAFAGHSSCKHVFVVDKDIDIYNPLEVEWAMATRFQGDRDLVIRERSSGSSLDPSAEPGSHSTTRLGFDLTKPLTTHGKAFNKAVFPRVDLSRFIKESL
jgi:2,5-furandicarboxylate decarboxylase 1